MSRSDFISRLNELLSTVKKKVDTISAGTDEIFIFGAGNTSKLYAKCFETEELRPSGFLDNDLKKQGTMFTVAGGVLSPLSLQGRDDVLVLICSLQISVQRAVSSQLKQLRLKFLTVDEYVFSKRTNEILRCAELLEDEESVAIYAELIECRLTGRLPSAKFINQEQYFALPKFFMRKEKETFVDCGAFVGDSVEKYKFSIRHHGALYSETVLYAYH